MDGISDICKFIWANCWGYWVPAIQAIAATFTILTAYSYYYRKKLEAIKRVQKRQKLRISKLVKLMSDLSEKTRGELEHESLSQAINSVVVQMNANFEVVGIQLKEILNEQKKTNGRVTALEETTDFIKILKKYKWLFALFILGLLKTIELIDIKRIISAIF
jgi:hypothetical protein